MSRDVLQPSNGRRTWQDEEPTAKRPRQDENFGASLQVDEILERGASRPCGPLAAARDFGGPTSYAGLIPTVAEGAAPQRRLKTFHDVASSRHRPHAAPTRPLCQVDWMPPETATRIGSGRDVASGHTAAPGGFAEGGALPPAAFAPIDWSLKLAARFSSPQPFTVWHEARVAPRLEVAQAQRSFTACSGVAALGLQQRLLAALLTWQFPQDPRDPAASSSAAAARPLAPELACRRRHWQAALASVYDALRCGYCDAFYVVSPSLPAGVGKKPFAALFRAAGGGGHRRLHALLTRSTPGLRALLEQQCTGFAAPLMPPSPELETGDGSRGGSGGGGAAPRAAVEGARSLLVFEGALRVAGLFELLLNRAFALHDDACDVPVLLAPVHFAHASLRSCQLDAPLGGAPGGGGSGRAAVHQLLLRGPHLPPWVVDRVLGVLSVTQSEGVTLAADVRPETATLNWQPSASDGGASAAQACGADNAAAPLRLPGEHEAQARGCLGAEEAARWRRATPGLSGSAVRELSVAAGCVAVTKLSSRVLAVPAGG